MAEERLVSLAEAAAISGLSAGHLNYLARKGKLSARKIGRNWVTTEQAVAQYLRDSFKRSKDPYKHRRS